jgi:hypothetical protein
LYFYTDAECRDWLQARGCNLPEDLSSGMVHKSVKIPFDDRALWYFAHGLANDLQACVLRVLLWLRYWNEDERVCLYHQLRQSYGERRTVDEAPGHLFLTHETSALACFLFAAMLYEWEGYLMDANGYVITKLTDHGYVEFFSRSEASLDFVAALNGSTPEEQQDQQND